jgi:hypothetical protein
MEENKPIIRYADLLDTKYTIPGTKIQFGYDFLIGLLPGAGDIISFFLSSGLIVLMIRKGASGRALAWMIVNVVLDTAIGAIPVVGDIFDLFFKANRRNLDLFQDHFEEGKYQGSAWSVILPIVILILLILVAMVYFIYWLISSSYQLVSGIF